MHYKGAKCAASYSGNVLLTNKFCTFTYPSTDMKFAPDAKKAWLLPSRLIVMTYSKEFKEVVLDIQKNAVEKILIQKLI